MSKPLVDEEEINSIVASSNSSDLVRLAKIIQSLLERVKDLEKENSALKNESNDEKQPDLPYNKEIVGELVSLKVGTLEEAIEASKQVVDMNNINDVSEKIKELKEIEVRQDIFGEEKMYDTSATMYYVDRIKHILSKYDSWIDGKSKLDIMEVVCGSYKIQTVKSFIKDYDQFVSNIDKLDYYIDGVCSVEKCHFISRGFRDISACRENNAIRTEIYNGVTNEKGIALMQMLDVLHNTLFHTYEMGLRVKTDENKEAEEKKMAQEAADAEDLEADDDEYLSKEVKDDEGQHSTKLTTLNNVINQRSETFVNSRPDYNPDIGHAKPKENENDNNEKKRNDNSEKERVLKRQESASEAAAKVKNKINTSNKFVTNINEKGKDGMVTYSFGHRFYYHDFYKKINEDEVHICANIMDRGNPGYKIRDWYIAAKYKDLKDELLNNKIYSLKLHEWENTNVKAQMKREGAKHTVEKAAWYWAKVTGIKEYSEITHHHVMSILLYTNWTTLCTKFSASYRKGNSKETDQDLRSKHGEFAIWGRLLRETVEQFGTVMGNSTIPCFYHGISVPMIFNSLSAKFTAPTSTTKTFAVALNFATKGVIITFNNTKGATPYWDCKVWSDYPSEDECLFVGGLWPMTIDSLCEVAQSKDYSCYIRTMGIFSLMITGFVAWKPLDKKHAAVIKKMINYRLNLVKSKFAKPSKSKDPPPYMSQIFNRVCEMMKDVMIGVSFFKSTLLQIHPSWGKLYGYKKLKKIFWNESDTFINLAIVKDLFPNVRSMTVRGIEIRDHSGNDQQIFIKCCNLNDALLKELVDNLTVIKSIKKIHIVYPDQSLEELKAICEKTWKKPFAGIGFKLTQGDDTDGRFGYFTYWTAKRD